MSRFTHLPYEIPTADSGELEELYAFLGGAVFVAQGLELEITNLAVGLQAAGATSLAEGDISSMFDEKEAKTFGALLSDVRKHALVDAATEAQLRLALSERNRLVHRFVYEHDDDLLSSAGRREMIEDLRLIIQRFADADAASSRLCLRLWESLGLTQEAIAAGVEAKMVAAAARDITM